MRHAHLLLSASLALSACAAPVSQSPGGMESPRGASMAGPAAPVLPPAAGEAAERLTASPRHSEWTTIGSGAGDSVRLWVVYPERADRAPVVLLVHENVGLTRWIRAVADQLAAEGFLVVAPDLLTGSGVPEEGGEPEPEAARAAIRTLRPADVQRRLDAAAAYATSLPAALPVYGIMGFCWGGAVAFAHAAHSPDVRTAVVFYGTSPDADALREVRAPVLGLYGENDARVNATIEPAALLLDARGVVYEREVFPGAGHGFLRARSGQEGANRAASEAAWPRAVGWLRLHLEGRR